MAGNKKSGRKAGTKKELKKLNVSMPVDQYDRLHGYAEENGWTDSLAVRTIIRKFLEKQGLPKMKKNNWYVANYKGEVSGHDLSEDKARENAKIMSAQEPDQEWEALQAE